MGFFVQFWGTRGSIPTPGWQTRRFGGNTSCVEIRVDDSLFICDAGTGIRELGVHLLKGIDDKEPDPVVAHLFFSHPHWDHIQGFPFFTPLYVMRNTFHVYGDCDAAPGTENRYFELLSGQMTSDYFPVAFHELGAKIEPAELGPDGRYVDETYVSWFKQFHPGGSYAYKFEHGGHRVVYATDNELDLTIQNKVECADDPSIPRRVDAGYLDFIRGADLLIADGQYFDTEYPSKKGWGHARATTIVDAAAEAGVKQLAIHHHDPMHSDEDVDRKIQICRERAARYNADLTIFGARERMQLRIDRDDEESLDEVPTTNP